MKNLKPSQNSSKMNNVHLSSFMYSSTQKFLKISIIALTALSLAGCGGSGTQQKPTSDERSRVIENTEYTMRIPREWDTIESKDFTSDVPQETAIVVRNNVKN